MELFLKNRFHTHTFDVDKKCASMHEHAGKLGLFVLHQCFSSTAAHLLLHV